jgi:hypothetical protein
MPYEEITEEKYKEISQNMKAIDFDSLYEEAKNDSKVKDTKMDPKPENYCDNDNCSI